MEACLISWLETQKKFTRAEKRDLDFVKRAFKLTFLGVAAPVLTQVDDREVRACIFHPELASYYSRFNLAI